MKTVFQTYIFERFMKENGRLDALEQEYNSWRKSSGREKRVVCQLDRDIYADYQNKMLFQDLQKKYDRSYYQIYKSIQLAANEARMSPMP